MFAAAKDWDVDQKQIKRKRGKKNGMQRRISGSVK